MQDVGFHVLVWLVFLSRDTLFFWDLSRGARPERLIWLVLCFVKMLTSVTLLGVAAARVEAAAADDTPVDFLSGIERYTLHGKRVM